MIEKKQRKEEENSTGSEKGRTGQEVKIAEIVYGEKSLAECMRAVIELYMCR